MSHTTQQLNKTKGERTFYLENGCLDLQDLLVPLDLPDADLAGELGGGGSVALQGEGTVQRLLAAAPHARERDFLSETRIPPERGSRRKKERGVVIIAKEGKKSTTIFSLQFLFY